MTGHDKTGINRDAQDIQDGNRKIVLKLIPRAFHPEPYRAS
jgi:hypothetical protein